MPPFPLYAEEGWTFRFAENRLIDEFFLPEGVEGTAVTVHLADPRTSGPGASIREARVGAQGKVAFCPPLVVLAGVVLIVLPKRSCSETE
jgi:hypothetical protein